MADQCKRVMLARGPVVQVEICEHCGVFHLSIESMTVRFRAQAVESLGETIASALVNYKRYVAGAVPTAAARLRLREDVH